MENTKLIKINFSQPSLETLLTQFEKENKYAIRKYPSFSEFNKNFTEDRSSVSIIFFLDNININDYEELLNSGFVETNKTLFLANKNFLPYSEKIKKNEFCEFIIVEDFNPASFALFARYFFLQNISPYQEAKKISDLQHGEFEEGLLLHSLMDNIPDNIYFKDAQSRFIKLNNSIVKTFGFKNEDEVIGKTDFDIFLNEHAQQAFNDEQEIIRTGKPLIGIEEKETWPDGSITWVSTTKLPLKNNSGKIIGTFGVTRDITKHKETELNLVKAKERVEQIYRLVPCAIFTVDKDEKITSWNKRAEEMTGYKYEEIIGQPCSTFSEKECFYKCGLFNNSIKKPVYFSKCEIVKKDGTVISVSKNVDYLRDEEGSIIGGIETFEDITEKEKTLLAHIENETRVKAVQRISNLGSMELDIQTHDCKWSDEFFRICGLEPQSFLPTLADKLKVVHPEDKELVEKSLKDSIENDTEYSLEERILRPTGEIRNVLSRGEVIKDFKNRPAKFITAFLDITERKQFEKIQRAQYEISEAINLVPDINALYKKIHEVVKELTTAENFYIALFDEEEQLLSFPYFIDQFDSTPEPRKLGRGLTEYVLRVGSDVLMDKNKYEELLKEGEIKQIGSLQSVWLGIPLKIGSKTIGVMVVQDYTNEKFYGEKERQLLLFVSEQIALAIERKRNADKLFEYSEVLKQLNATKDKFFSIIAHDLKNPFVTLLGYSELLINEFDELTDEEKITFITDIRNSSKHSFELLENLLHWSRSQTGRLEYEPSKIDVKELVDKNILLLSPMAKNKAIDLHSGIAAPITAYADHDMVNTVIRNLISNAVKFTMSGGHIKITAELENNFIKIGITDDGVGMDDKTLRKLFRLDEHHSTKGTSNEAGTGLGLILCKEFIEKNHGKIWAESEINKGTTFHFTIPTDERFVN